MCMSKEDITEDCDWKQEHTVNFTYPSLKSRGGTLVLWLERITSGFPKTLLSPWRFDDNWGGKKDICKHTDADVDWELSYNNNLNSEWYQNVGNTQHPC